MLAKKIVEAQFDFGVNLHLFLHCGVSNQRTYTLDFFFTSYQKISRIYQKVGWLFFSYHSY